MRGEPWSGPIVDAHQHFWDPFASPHPWLAPGVRIPFRYGDYEAIKRRYLPPEYRQDAARQDVVATVYVETEWDPADPLGETRYAAALAAEHGLPNAIVAQAWLDRADVADVLAGQAACGLVRSVRHKPARAGARTLMSNERWRRGYALLASHGLHFDLQTPWPTLGEAVSLARDFPATTIVLNHAGLPADRSEEGLRGWRTQMARLADAPNVAVKISGLGLPGRPWRVEENGPLVRDIIAMFGPERAMFASNFPVDSLCADFDTIFDGFKSITADLPRATQEELFCGTARRIYRTQAGA